MKSYKKEVMTFAIASGNLKVMFKMYVMEQEATEFGTPLAISQKSKVP